MQRSSTTLGRTSAQTQTTGVYWTNHATYNRHQLWLARKGGGTFNVGVYVEPFSGSVGVFRPVEAFVMSNSENIEGILVDLPDGPFARITVEAECQSDYSEQDPNLCLIDVHLISWETLYRA